jgi:hypothetical protein
MNFYQKELFNTDSLRVGPWCNKCERRMLFIEENSVAAPQRTTDQSPCVLLISGSCASGKSTISHLIASTYGAVQIDGDWMLQLRKIELGEKPDFNDIHMDMLTMAQGFASMGKDVVVAHVILPEALPLYESFLKQKRIRYLFASAGRSQRQSTGCTSSTTI